MKKIKMGLSGICLLLIFALSTSSSTVQAEEFSEGGGCELNGVKNITPVFIGAAWHILCNCSDHLGKAGAACEVAPE